MVPVEDVGRTPANLGTPVHVGKVDGLAQRIVKASANVAGMSKDKFVRSDSRVQSVVRIRAACAFLLRESIGMSLPEIGRTLHYSDHTTVHYHLKKLKKAEENRESTGFVVEEIKKEMRRIEGERGGGSVGVGGEVGEVQAVGNAVGRSAKGAGKNENHGGGKKA